jgi:DNA invertase Pin-like site-specific DNA recombinase
VLNQLQELRRYIQARGWTGQEFVDRGVSGSKDKHRALDALIRDARRRRFDVLVCWRLDRLGRNLRHLVTLFEELQTLGVAFVSLCEGNYPVRRPTHLLRCLPSIPKESVTISEVHCHSEDTHSP